MNLLSQHNLDIELIIKDDKIHLKVLQKLKRNGILVYEARPKTAYPQSLDQFDKFIKIKGSNKYLFIPIHEREHFKSLVNHEILGGL